MPNWKFALRIQPEWEAAKNDDITVQQLAKVIADRLEAIDFGEPDNFEASNLVELFRDFAEEENGDKNEFDNIFAMLYDFADDVKLWIQTII